MIEVQQSGEVGGFVRERAKRIDQKKHRAPTQTPQSCLAFSRSLILSMTFHINRADELRTLVTATQALLTPDVQPP